MADEEKAFQFPGTVSKFLLEPLNHGIAAANRQALKQGVQAHELIELHLNHLASVVAMVEPAGAREELIRQLVGSFASMVKQHVDVRYTTEGGVKLPRPSDRISWGDIPGSAR